MKKYIVIVVLVLVTAILTMVLLVGCNQNNDSVEEDTTDDKADNNVDNNVDNDVDSTTHMHEYVDYAHGEIVMYPKNCTEREKVKCKCLWCDEYVIRNGQWGDCVYSYYYKDQSEHLVYCIYCYDNFYEEHNFIFNEVLNKDECITCGGFSE